MTFVLRDLLLASAGGVVIGVWLAVRASRDRRHRPLARIMAFALEPIFHWFDLYGPDGRPSHTKSSYFITLLVALYGWMKFGAQELKAGHIESGFVWLTLLVLAFALGRTAYLGFLQSKLGDKLADFMAPRHSGSYSPTGPGGDEDQTAVRPGPKQKPPGMHTGDYENGLGD